MASRGGALWPGRGPEGSRSGPSRYRTRASWRISCRERPAVSGRKRVLVVDDDPEIRRLLAGVLVDAGYDAQTAVDGEHAFRSVVALHPDLVILDVHVPEYVLALQFVEAYRDRVPAEQRAPIIACSGVDDLEAISRQLGASGSLKKPFDIEELMRTVDKYLGAPMAAEAPAAAPVEAAIVPQAEPGTATV